MSPPQQLEKGKPLNRMAWYQGLMFYNHSRRKCSGKRKPSKDNDSTVNTVRHQKPEPWFVTVGWSVLKNVRQAKWPNMPISKFKRSIQGKKKAEWSFPTCRNFFTSATMSLKMSWSFSTSNHPSFVILAMTWTRAWMTKGASLGWDAT